MKYALLSAIALLLSSCSVFWDSADSSEPKHQFSSPAGGAQADSAKAPSAQDSPSVGSTPDVALVWKIPQEPVDGFIVRYGSSKDRLPNEVRVSVAELEKSDDPRFGFVYRYYLKGVSPSQTLFVSIAAFQGDVVSPPSNVMAVK